MTGDERRLGGLLVVAAAAGFGTLAVFGKLATAVGLDTSTLLLFRFVVATVAVRAAFGPAAATWPSAGRPLAVSLAIGVVYGAMTWLFFLGLDYLAAGVAAVVFYTYPAFVFGLSAVVLDERPGRRELLALGASLAGVGLLVGANPAGADPVGVALVLAAAAGYATYATASRVLLASVDPASLTATALVATTASMVPLGALAGGLSLPGGLHQWLVVVGIGVVGTAAPIVLFVRGLERIEASRASVIGTAEPAVTVLLGAALLGEPVTPVLVAGGALVLCGVLLVGRDGRPAGMVAH